MEAAVETAGNDFAEMREMERRMKAAALVEAIEVFTKAGAKFTHHEEINQLVVEGCRGRLYYYSPSTGKWRQQGKGQWYRSRSPEEFLTKYALKTDRPAMPFEQERHLVALLLVNAPNLPEAARREVIKTVRLVCGHLPPDRAADLFAFAVKLAA